MYMRCERDCMEMWLAHMHDVENEGAGIHQEGFPGIWVSQNWA